MTARPDGGTDAAGRLTHLDEHGQAHMVDVTAKPLTRRLAVARCAVVTTVDATAALGEAGRSVAIGVLVVGHNADGLSGALRAHRGE